MAAAIISELFRLFLASDPSTGDATFYLSAACFVLRRENGGKQGRELLLAALLERLEVDRAASPAHSDSELLVEKEDENMGAGGEMWECVWQLCREVGGENGKTLHSFVCERRHFLSNCCQLVLAALALGGGSSSGVLRERENTDCFLLQFHERFWKTRIENLFAKHASTGGWLVHDDTATATAWYQSIKHVALLHTLQKMWLVVSEHCSTLSDSTTSQTSFQPEGNGIDSLRSEDSAVINRLLCSNVSNPLADSVARTLPQALHIVYVRWWNSDAESLKDKQEIPTAYKKRVGHIIKVCIYTGVCVCVFVRDF